jgi:tetratricopeptide (TPR) repeat protein
VLNIHVLLDRAGLLLDQGRYKDAESEIRKALEHEPRNDYALALLGRCYINATRYDEGIDVMQQAISIDPHNDFYFYLIAFGHYHKDQYTQAVDHLEKAIRLNPYNAEYFGLLAHILLQKKEFEPALDKANEGLALDPENITCLNARSIALNKLKRTEDAIATMQTALAQDPDNEITHATVGWNFLEKGKHKEATGHFMEALRIRPGYDNAKTGLKEALKSKVLPYRLLLQYSFWMNNKGKTLQRAMPFIIYIVFRILVGVLNSNESTSGLTWILVGVYILFVVTTWTINSIANFFLLSHPVGKYALTNTEKWAAITSVPSLLIGLVLLSLSVSGVAEHTRYTDLFIAGLVCVSLALPFSRIEYPVRLPGRTWKEWYSLALLAGGVISLLIYSFVPAIAQPLFIVYGVALIIYTWVIS